jgi:hypothetical protein
VVHLIDKTNYLNHYYLVSVLAALMVLLPLGVAGSVERGSTRARPTVPAWTVWALRAQLGLVYFYGGIAKLNADWLFARSRSASGSRRAATAAARTVLERQWVAYAFSWAGAAFDLAIVPFLLWRRTRLVAYGSWSSSTCSRACSFRSASSRG